VLYLAAAATLLALGAGYLAYGFALGVVRHEHATQLRARARLLAAAASGGGDAEDEAHALERIAALWCHSTPPAADGFLCVVDRKGRLLYHTRHPECVGQAVGDGLILEEDGQVRCRLGELAADLEEHVGGYVPRGGKAEIAAFVPVPERGWLLGLHRSKAQFEAEIRSGLWPLVLAFLVACGLFLPAALLGIYLTLRRSHRDLAQLNRSLEERVHSRTAELEAMSEEMEAFAYSVSHDLRAPLRAIDGFSLAVVEECADELGPEAAGLLARVRAAATHMDHLISDLLRLSVAARARPRLAQVDLSAMAQRIVKRLGEDDPEREVAVTIQPGLQAACDGALMELALENLLSNAWRFSTQEAAPRIEFGAQGEASELVYFVSDNGVGFDMAQAERLFRPFQRLHSASPFPGTGIGLAIVQRVIRRHGGRVWATSRSGQGATFYFTCARALGGTRSG